MPNPQALRRRRAREVDVLLALLLLALLSSGGALAQGGPGPEGHVVPALAPAAADADSVAWTPGVEYRVGAVRVRGNAHTDSVRIIRTFEVLPGTRYADAAVRRGIRKLFALGLFSDVAVDKAPAGGRMDLIIVVKERPRIGKIEFRGNAKRKSEDLEKKLILHVGEVYSPVAVQSQVDSLVEYYRDEGFSRATIEAVSDTAADGGLDLRFAIQEGEKVRITGIEFAGARAFPVKKLRKQLKARAKGFLGGGGVKDEDAAEDQEKLERFYHDHGYRDMRMLAREVLATADPRKLTLRITVEEGRPYRMGTARWSGNEVLTAGELAPLWRVRPGERYDASRIEKVQGLVYAEYAEKGYLYVGVDPQETVRDSDLVDVTFVLGEGRPSKVRYVNISGNRMTREKVIRRELELREGDRFKRSALMRTQGELSRLGLFEEVLPDFAPAESTDVDIQIKVKEKQVGTASAGAGYTGTTGMTGFLELGHNNVLGNGQSLALHLERGSRRSDYSLSFTEPWFHDNPTLLGISAFNMSAELDLYREQRRGGSVRIGRPLPWPDYSRGSIGYSLEDVTISQFGLTFSRQDSIVLSGVATGEPVRTSSVLLDFNRNSTDNAFYPTRGTRLTLTSELAGGPFLGAVNFIKSRVEGRIYLPSFMKHLTTMARARAGVLGIWAGQGRDVPRYERFRLGGGTVADPLRGYDDYMIVPEKFIRTITTTTRTIVSIDTTDPAHPDTTFSESSYTSKVRYPGGRYMTLYSLEQQFPIVVPLRGVVFFDAGNTWDQWGEIQPFKLKMSVGLGFRMEIPMLGNIGFDYGYGFNRDDWPHGKGHFLLGNVSF
jgi:outer membrane protein insertion porin family